MNNPDYQFLFNLVKNIPFENNSKKKNKKKHSLLNNKK